MKIKIVLTGKQDQETRTVEIDASGASLDEVCKAANVDTKNKDFTIDGKPATLDMHVGKKSKVEISARPQTS